MKSKFIKSVVGTLSIVGMSLGLTVLTYASDSGPAEDMANTFKVKSRYIASSDVHAVSGDVQINEIETEFEHEYMLQDKLPIDFALNVKHIDIDQGIPLDIPSHLEGRSFRLGTKFPLPFSESEHYFVGVDIIPSFYTDDYNWESSAFRIPLRTYLVYKRDESLIFVGGLTIRPDYDDAVLPLLGVIYKPNDRLSFNLASDDPNISYKINDKTTAFMEFDITYDEYEVTREGQKGVILKYRDTSMGTGVKYNFNRNIFTTLSVGGVFNRRLHYENDNGKVVPEQSLYTQLRVNASF